ncbi:MAG: AgmX/PglI C-terminal domain-containing protein, partial [Solirubrobacterales bacterium]|nr:AgmX/PglI C-terminal domain-containing protein [Solirubrobacterales bacterium]
DIRPAATKCYEQRAASDPNEGRLFLLLKIAPSGDVATATVTSNTGLSEDVARCIVDAAGRAHFAPGASGSQMSVPFHFPSSH